MAKNERVVCIIGLIVQANRIGLDLKLVKLVYELSTFSSKRIIPKLQKSDTRSVRIGNKYTKCKVR